MTQLLLFSQDFREHSLPSKSASVEEVDKIYENILKDDINYSKADERCQRMKRTTAAEKTDMHSIIETKQKSFVM